MSGSVCTNDDLRDHLIHHAESIGKGSIESTNVTDASTNSTILNDPKESGLSTEDRGDLGNSEYSDETAGHGETDTSDETGSAETFVPRGKITLLTTTSKPTKDDKNNERS